MSNNATKDDFENWLGSLDTGRHYRNTDAYMSLVYEQISSDLRGHHPPGKSPRSDRPVHASLPRERFEEVVHFSRNSFVEALENDETKRLRRLEESLPTRLEVLREEVSDLSQRIDSVDNVQDRFSELDERYDSLNEAAGANAMPEELEPHGLDYLATGSLGDEVDVPIYLGEDSPLRIAAHARLVGGRLREERKPKRAALAIGQLRLRILEYVLGHFEVLGFPPQKVDEKEIETEAENKREEVKQSKKPGAPGLVAEGRSIEERIPILDDLLGDPKYWKVKNGEPIHPDYQAIHEEVTNKYEELFPLSKSGLRKFIKRSNIDLDDKRDQVQEKLEDVD